MFTGIITDIGTVKKYEKTVNSANDWADLTIGILSSYDSDTIDLGASIACNGVCLTVTKKHNTTDGKGYFEAEVSNETLSKTTLGLWKNGDIINLERALRMGDELGGHMVSGHVDTVAKVTDIKTEGDSHRFTFEFPENIAKHIAPKGSIVLNGTSLTINEVQGNTFGVNLIPHTMKNTTFHNICVEDKVNLEIDVISRYVARILGKE